MSRRLVKDKARGYHAFPWSRPAMVAAIGMSGRVTLRKIAADLVARGLVAHRPDPATVRRMLISPEARRLELELLMKSTHGKSGLAELPAVKGGQS
jgi:hypothetical protein